MRRWTFPLLGAAFLFFVGPGEARVFPGPYNDTVTSLAGSLIWYVGKLDLTGRTWRDLDRICGTVPVPQVIGWRAPTEEELRTLMYEIPKEDGPAKWKELYLSNPMFFWPAIAAFFDERTAQQRRTVQPQVNLLMRDIYTYEGKSTTLDQVEKGHMYSMYWFNRWTKPWWDREQNITFTPGDYKLGPSEVLLCVADRKTS